MNHETVTTERVTSGALTAYRGGAKDYVQYICDVHTALIPSAKSLAARVQSIVQSPLKGHGSSRVLDAFSWYLRLSLILKHSDKKNLDLNHSPSKFRGGARLLRPHLGPPLCDWVMYSELGYFACSPISGFNDDATI